MLWADLTRRSLVFDSLSEASLGIGASLVIRRAQ